MGSQQSIYVPYKVSIISSAKHVKHETELSITQTH